MSSNTLDNFHRRFNAFIAEAAAELDAERLAHEQRLASALESLSQDGACQAAYRDGREIGAVEVRLGAVADPLPSVLQGPHPSRPVVGFPELVDDFRPVTAS